MKFDPMTCPECNGPATGTLEVVQGCAELSEPDENGIFEYAGNTNIFWDEQKTVLDNEGRATLFCDCGAQWQANILDDGLTEEQ
jgi:hypothetical protein